MADYIRVCCLTLVVLTGLSGAARADWYSLRNETKQVLVVQEVVSMKGQQWRVKPKRLSPGETARELLPRPAEKHLIIHDPRRPDRPLFNDSIMCSPGQARFVIRATPKGVKIEPVKENHARKE